MTETPETPDEQPLSPPTTSEPPAAADHPTTAHDAAPTTPVEPVAVAPTSSGSTGRIVGYLAAGLVGVALTVAALLATGSLELGFAASTTPSPSEPAAASADPSSSADPGNPTPATEGRVQGDPDAAVTIEIWADFQCPFCGLSAKGVEPEVVRQYAGSGQAQVVFRDFAFLGEESFDSAVAARCAGDQGRFWHFHDLLFASQQGENQGAFARERLLNLASFAGLEPEAFEACLDDPAIRTEVEAETAEGREVGIVSTPTWRLVGPGGAIIVTGLKPLADVEAAFEQASDPNFSPEPSPSPSPEPSPSPSS
jgi:protein-disulfide isomerase